MPEFNQSFPLLSILIFAPTAGAVILSLIPAAQTKLLRSLALAVSVIVFAFSLPLFFDFEPSRTGFQFEEKHAWIPVLGSTYHVGVDGLSLLMILFVVISKITGNIGVPGWATVVFLLLLATGMIMLSLGIIGEYLARIMREVRGSPAFLIRDELIGGGVHRASRFAGYEPDAVPAQERGSA